MRAVVKSHEQAVKFLERAASFLGNQYEKPHVVEIKEFKPIRSVAQNALFHAMINELALEIGYAPSELKDWFKSEYGPTRYMKICGIDKSIPISTTLYNKVQMAEMIGHIEGIGAEMGFTFKHEQTEVRCER